MLKFQKGDHFCFSQSGEFNYLSILNKNFETKIRFGASESDNKLTLDGIPADVNYNFIDEMAEIFGFNFKKIDDRKFSIELFKSEDVSVFKRGLVWVFDTKKRTIKIMKISGDDLTIHKDYTRKFPIICRSFHAIIDFISVLINLTELNSFEHLTTCYQKDEGIVAFKAKI